MRGRIDIACPHKKQRLEERMVQRVQQRSGHTCVKNRIASFRLAEQRGTESDKDDPDIFDARIGEQFLHIVQEKPQIQRLQILQLH